MPATPFVGRRTETAEVRRLLSTGRVVTLTGPPGVGKTRLALQAANDAARSFQDGTYVVELGGLRDPGLLAQEVAGALGLHDASTRWALDELVRHVGERAVLVVLDNCEHLLDACAVLVDSLVRACGALRVMATSRQSLGIPEETVLRVPPLAVPEEGAVQAEAVELLLVRGNAVQPGQGATAVDMEQAAELCRRLEGIPLAIELAAVRLKTLSMEQILARVDDRFAVLGEANRAAPAHQRTLRAALDWSRDLALLEEWILWQRLSVFPSSFELSAAEAVCSGEGLRRDQVLDALDGLVDKSIVAATRAGHEMRYRLLDSIREYGAEALRSSGHEPLFRSRHRDHYAGLCQAAWRHWTGPEQPGWFDRLAREHDNLRAAQDWCVENGEAEAGAAMAADLWLYWEARGHLTEGRRRLATLVAGLRRDAPVRAKALWVAGYLALAQTDGEAAAPLLQDSIDAGDTSDPESVAFATQYLGLCALFGGDFQGAADGLERAFELHAARNSGAAAFTLTDLAITVMLAGDVARASGLYARALAMASDPWTRSHCLWGSGLAAWLEGDVDAAEETQKQALRLIAEVDERSGTALCLDALAWIAASRRNIERAAVLQGAARAIWESIPRALPAPLHQHDQRCEHLIRHGLGTHDRDRLFDTGRRLDRTAAVAYGLEAQGEPDHGSLLPPPDTGGLSRRELEVADLVAAGLTDREIAARLVISQRTAESHVQHILAKLGFRSRAQIAAWKATRTARTP